MATSEPLGRPLRVLITNLTLASRSGTECYVRDLAGELLRRGHTPVVYSPQLGALAEELRAATVPVVDDLERLGAPPDLIHGHHVIPTLAALHAFPDSPGLFVCHDRLAWHDAPPLHPRLLRYLAVDDNCRDRLVLEAGVPEERVRTLLNWVDLTRFRPRGPLPERPRRALLFSNYTRADGLLPALQAACGEAGLSLDVLGGDVQRSSPEPERVLLDYDVVFAKGRSALEALAVGAAVVLCGVARLGPLVAPADFERLRRQNFGMRAIQWPAEAGIALDQLRRYDPQAAALVSARVRAEAALEPAVERLLALYAELLAEWGRGPRPAPEDERRATARAFQALDVLALRLGAQAERIESLGRELRRLVESNEPMPPLSEAEARLVSLEAKGLPQRLAPGASQAVEVRLDNRSERLLCSAPPWPVHIGARWWDAQGPEPLSDAGPRTPLLPPLEPQSEGRYFATVRAPHEPGAYRLRLTLVQEEQRWFDDLPGLCAEALVIVA